MPHSRSREGFWFNVGFGYGGLTCKDCNGTAGGLTVGLSLGGTLSPRLSVGVGTMGWTKSESGSTLTVATVDARVRFYPSETGGFFLTGGAGVGTIGADVTGVGRAGETGFGLAIGVGMDFRASDNVNVTPFWNGFAIRTTNADVSVNQLGLGLTFH